MNKKVTIGEVVSFLDATFRPELQEDYDNAGFLLGESGRVYHGALVALDLTTAVVDEAIEKECNLIVTHHPFIFSGLKRITDHSETGRTVMRLIQNGIAVYAAHTNLDNLPWGVSGVLAEKLGLVDCKILKGEMKNEKGECEVGAGIVGNLREPKEMESVLMDIKRLLGSPVVRTTPYDSQTVVRRIALCGGSGAEFIPDAMAARADLYLTADLKYHDFQRGNGRIVLADAGHYETEQFAKDIIYRVISEKFSNFACRISESQQSLVRYI